MRHCPSCSSPKVGRRDFLRGAAALGAFGLASRFGQNRLFAQAPGGGRRFLFVYVPGGWDQLLFLDPREFELAAATDADYQKEVQRTQIDTSYRYGIGSLVGAYAKGAYFQPTVYKPAGTTAPFSFGPGAVPTAQDGTPLPGPNLVSLAERGVPMSIVRGINMGTLGHQPGYVYFLTGEPAVGSVGRGTSMPIRLAAGLGEQAQGLADTIVPVLAMGVESYTGNHPGRYGAFVLQNMGDVTRMLRREPSLLEHPDVEAALATYASARHAALTTKEDPSGLLRQIGEGQGRTASLFASDLAARFDFLTAGDAVSAAVRAKYELNAASDLASPGAIAAFAAQTVKYGFAQFASVAFTKNGVDTHGTSNPGHLGNLWPCLRALSQLVDDLATTPAAAPLQGSWMDNTTIVVFSEFARTPLHNLIKGRDHHFTSSCLLMGAGVKPGTVVGGSTEVGGMQPRYYDFGGGALLPDGAKPANEMQRYILPEDIGATLLASAGLSYAEYRNGRPLWAATTVAPF